MKQAKTKLITIAVLVIIQLLTACSQTKELSEEDTKLINELGFDTELMKEIRNLSDSSFLKTTGYDDKYWCFKDSSNYLEFSRKNLASLKINESSKKAAMIVNRLRDLFNDKGYFIYISESNFGYSPDEITVLKTNDKFDVLRFEGTSGVNYDIYVEDVIDKLSDWDKNYGIKIIGVGFDFLVADYNKLPDNLNKHADELYKFCPDIVDQGVGTVSELKKEILNTKQLYLWWD